MIYTVVGDPHAKPSNVDLIIELMAMVEELGNPVIWLGDMLDTKEVVRSKCFNLWFDYFKDSDLKHIVLVGNHDWHNLECKDHSLRPLQELKNVQVVDEAWEIDGMGFLPFMSDLNKFREELKVLEKTCTAVFIHQGINDFDFGNGFVEENGIDQSDLPGDIPVISGHFHMFQHCKNLTYLGTPFSHSFGETDQLKYIGTYDTDTKKLTTIETPFPRHRTEEVTVREWKRGAVMNSKDHLRVILTGSAEEIATVDKAKHPDIKFIERPDEEELGSAAIKETASNHEKFTTWAKEVKNLDKETLKLGLRIMDDVV